VKSCARGRVVLSCMVFAHFATPQIGCASDSVDTSLEGTHFSGDGTGYGGSVTWQHSAQPGGWDLGLQQNNYPDGSLFVANAEGNFKTGDLLTWSGGVTAGNGREAGEQFNLLKLYGAVDVHCAAPWWLQLRDQYVTAALLHGQLLVVGTTYVADSRWQVHFEGGTSASGNLGSHYAQVVIHHYTPLHLFVGVVAGEQNYDPTQLGELPFHRDLREAYTGVGIPLGTIEVGVRGDWIELGSSTRLTLRVDVTAQVDP
jgi:hypothetical protein